MTIADQTIQNKVICWIRKQFSNSKVRDGYEQLELVAQLDFHFETFYEIILSNYRCTMKGVFMADFGTLSIDKVMMHGIPKGNLAANSPNESFTETPIPLEDEDRGYITLKLRATFAGRARAVIEDKDLESKVPDLIRGLVGDSGNLIGDSRQIASLLHGAQKWMSNAGLVMVVHGQIDGEKCLVVAKMEHQEGMRVQPTLSPEGLKTYKAEHFHDLILAEGTKVFKAGIFKASEAKDSELMQGLVADDQLSGQNVAEYFVNFLGCVFVRQADVMTELYFDETHRFLGKVTKEDPPMRTDYEIALIVDMQSASKRISPKSFAAKYLKGAHRDQFLKRMEEIGLPIAGFKKDTKLIETNIRRMKLQTSRGATLFVPPEMHDDGSLNVGKGKNGTKKSKIILIDEITSISGAGGPKKREKKSVNSSIQADVQDQSGS